MHTPGQGGETGSPGGGRSGRPKMAIFILRLSYGMHTPGQGGKRGAREGGAAGPKKEAVWRSAFRLRGTDAACAFDSNGNCMRCVRLSLLSVAKGRPRCGMLFVAVGTFCFSRGRPLPGSTPTGVVLRNATLPRCASHHGRDVQATTAEMYNPNYPYYHYLRSRNQQNRTKGL